jgi:hypothetical protein
VSISGSAVTYSAGGNGGGAGGAQGGSNTGKGGNSGGNVGGAGGSGIVIISYPIDGSTGVSTSSSGGTITTSGGKRIHTFTTGGNFILVGTSDFLSLFN